MSPAAQDCLKALYLEGEPGARGGELVSTTTVSHRLGVTAASATNMLKRLDALGLVSHVPYHGAELSETGRKVALEVIRHHRLLETYLAEALGVPWDEVHAEAEVLEHVLSEGLEERIAAHLGHPTLDPHGHPIPSKDLTMPQGSERRLWDASIGERLLVERVSDAHPDGLRYLARIGVRPGARLDITGRGPVGGPLFITVHDDGRGHSEALSRETAEAVWVS
jgi:DtxR family transcriptional regulator, Mn-dependent transcriptional regulator